MNPADLYVILELVELNGSSVCSGGSLTTVNTSGVLLGPTCHVSLQGLCLSARRKHRNTEDVSRTPELTGDTVTQLIKPVTFGSDYYLDPKEAQCTETSFRYS